MTPRGLAAVLLVWLTGCATGTPVGYRAASGTFGSSPPIRREPRAALAPREVREGSSSLRRERRESDPEPASSPPGTGPHQQRHCQ